jgi:hypothetical protein
MMITQNGEDLDEVKHGELSTAPSPGCVGQFFVRLSDLTMFLWNQRGVMRIRKMRK